MLHVWAMKKKLPYRLIHWTLALTDLHSAAPSIDTNLQGPSIALTNKYRHFFMLVFLLFASKGKFTLHRQTQCRQSPDYTMSLPILIQHVQLVKTRSDRLLRVTSNKTSRSETLKKCLLPFVAQCELALKVFLYFCCLISVFRNIQMYNAVSSLESLLLLWRCSWEKIYSRMSCTHWIKIPGINTW